MEEDELTLDELLTLPIQDIRDLTDFEAGQEGVWYKNVTLDTDEESGVSPSQYELEAKYDDVIAELIDPNALLNTTNTDWYDDRNNNPASTNTWEKGLITQDFDGHINIKVFDGYHDGSNAMEYGDADVVYQIAEQDYPVELIGDPYTEEDLDTWAVNNQIEDEAGDLRHQERVTVHFQWSPYYFESRTFKMEDGSRHTIFLTHDPSGWRVEPQD